MTTTPPQKKNTMYIKVFPNFSCLKGLFKISSIASSYVGLALTYSALTELGHNYYLISKLFIKVPPKASHTIYI